MGDYIVTSKFCGEMILTRQAVVNNSDIKPQVTMARSEKLGDAQVNSIRTADALMVHCLKLRCDTTMS